MIQYVTVMKMISCEKFWTTNLIMMIKILQNKMVQKKWYNKRKRKRKEKNLQNLKKTIVI